MSIIEKKVEKMADIVSGNDLVGMWNAFIEKDDEMQKLKERIGADFYDKFFHIRDNVVEQIGEICGNDYKKFVSEILDDYENSGYVRTPMGWTYGVNKASVFVKGKMQMEEWAAISERVQELWNDYEDEWK